MFRDVTYLVERHSGLEERHGVRFEAIFGSFEGPDNDGDYRIEVRGELWPTTGDVIGQDLDLVLSIYDSQNRLIENQTYWIDSDKFFGFHAFEFSFYFKAGELAKMRLYPRES